MTKIPTETPATELTELANKAQANPQAAPKFVAAIYAILREMAEKQLAQERNATVGPTELVQEVAVDLLKSGKATVYENREHVRAGLFRRIKNKLIDRGRHRRRLKRFSGTAEVSLDSPAAGQAADSMRGPLEIAASADDRLALARAMAKLELQHRNAHQVVQMRIKQYPVQKIADELDVSPKTIHRWSEFATAFLYGELVRRQDLPASADHHDRSEQRPGPAA